MCTNLFHLLLTNIIHRNMTIKNRNWIEYWRQMDLFLSILISNVVKNCFKNPRPRTDCIWDCVNAKCWQTFLFMCLYVFASHKSLLKTSLNVLFPLFEIQLGFSEYFFMLYMIHTHDGAYNKIFIFHTCLHISCF